MIQSFAKVIIQRPSGELLVLRRSATDSRRPGELDFPGGGVESGESLNEAASRELYEEAGIAIDPKELVLLFAATSYYDQNQDSNTRAVFYITVDDETADAVRISHEHDAAAWHSVQQAVDEHPHPVYREALQYAIDHQLISC